MEFIDNCQVNACSGPLPNGYANQIFQANPKARSANPMYQNSVGFSDNEQEDAVKSKKKARSSRIWNFVSRRKRPSMNSKRPQSMILLGNSMEILEPIRKMSFMERVRSFKKLRSSGLSKNACRAKISKISEEPQDGIEQNTLHRIKTLNDSQRPYRHSYAGFIEDLDSSFEDVELNSCVLDMDGSENKWHRNICVGLPSEDVGQGCQKVAAPKIGPPEVESPQESGAAQWDAPARCSSVTYENKKGRSSDVWSYLKGISLASKDKARLQSQNAGPSFQDVESIADKLPPYFDFETKCEETVRHPKKPSNAPKGSHFGGVLRFFSSVAVAAKKWRGSSKACQQGESKPDASFECQRQEISPQWHPLVIANKSTEGFLSMGVSPDSASWDNGGVTSSACQEIPQGNANAEISQGVCQSVPSGVNDGFNETFLPAGTTMPPFSVLEFPNDCCPFLSAHGQTTNVSQFQELLLNKGSNQGLGTAPIDAWILGSWGHSSTQGLDAASADAQKLDSGCLKPQDFTEAELEENSPLNEDWCDAEPNLETLCKDDTGSGGLSAACESIQAMPCGITDAQDLANSLVDIRAPCRPLLDAESLDSISQVMEDLDFTPADIPGMRTLVIDKQILEDISGDAQQLDRTPAHHPDLTGMLTDSHNLESSPTDAHRLSSIPTDTCNLDSVPEGNLGNSLSAPLTCPTSDKHMLDQEGIPAGENERIVPPGQKPTWKSPKLKHFAFRGVCHPFQMSLCTIVAINEFNSRKVGPSLFLFRLKIFLT